MKKLSIEHTLFHSKTYFNSDYYHYIFKKENFSRLKLKWMETFLADNVLKVRKFLWTVLST